MFNIDKSTQTNVSWQKTSFELFDWKAVGFEKWVKQIIFSLLSTYWFASPKLNVWKQYKQSIPPFSLVTPMTDF